MRPALAVVVVLLLPVSAGGGQLHDFVPRTVTVSVGSDHVFATFKSVVRPADVGEESWAAWDADGDGAISDGEGKRLLGSLRDRELEYLCLTVDGEVVALSRMPAQTDRPITIDGEVHLLVQGRARPDLAPGEHRFMLYDRPRTEDGIVPIRFNVVMGMQITGAQGARAELKGPRRLEAVVTRSTPAVWGTFVID